MCGRSPEAARRSGLLDEARRDHGGGVPAQVHPGPQLLSLPARELGDVGPLHREQDVESHQEVEGVGDDAGPGAGARAVDRQQHGAGDVEGLILERIAGDRALGDQEVGHEELSGTDPAADRDEGGEHVVHGDDS